MTAGLIISLLLSIITASQRVAGL